MIKQQFQPSCENIRVLAMYCELHSGSHGHSLHLPVRATAFYA